MPTESQLIAELKLGSSDAFDKIYALYCSRLFGYAFGYTRSRVEAQEIVQDVFVQLWLNRQTIRHEHSLAPMLFVIAKNRLINAYRSKLNSPLFEHYLSICTQEDCGSAESQHHTLDYDYYLKAIQIELKKMPRTQREVFNCSKIDQLSNKEIAQKLGISEQTVKNQLSICLKILREKLCNTLKV